MKVHKPIKLFIPKSMLQVVNENIKTNKENYIYIIHHLLTIPAKDKRFRETNEIQFVPINKKKLKCLFNCNIDRYVKLLQNYGLIECDKVYKKGEKSFHYRINPQFKFDCNYYELQPDTELFKNLIYSINKEKSNYSKLEPYLNEMRKEFMNIQFDLDSALEWVKELPNDHNKAIYSLMAYQFSDSRFRYYKRNDTNNRLDTNLTNLKSDLRRFIIGDYVSIDLSNSQPFLLSILFEKMGKILTHFTLKKLDFKQTTITGILNNKYLPLCLHNDILELVNYFGIQCFKTLLLIRKNDHNSIFTDLSQFKKWTKDGILYDEFVKKHSEQLTRDKIKNIMFEVLFSKNKVFDKNRYYIPFEKEKQIFSSVFPTIHNIIEALKEKDNAKLAIYLQQFESSLFIDKIAKQLVESNIIPLTIHDSVIVPQNKERQALEIIQAVFKKEVGINPTFKIVNLSK